MLVRIQTPYIEASTLRLLFLPLRCRSRSTKNCTGRTETACSQKRKAACRKYCPCLESSGRAKTKYRPDSCDFADQHSQYGQIRQKAGRREENAWYQAEGAFSGVFLVLWPSLTHLPIQFDPSEASLNEETSASLALLNRMDSDAKKTRREPAPEEGVVNVRKAVKFASKGRGGAALGRDSARGRGGARGGRGRGGGRGKR